MNGKMRLPIWMLACAAALALCACSVAPRGKTILLTQPATSAPAASGSPGGNQFTLEKVSVIPRAVFDQAGYFDPYAEFVFGWLDNDHLAAIGVKPIAQSTVPATVPAEKLPQKAQDVRQIGARGLVGQILSVDWQTHETTELHTVQDGVITGIGISHDRSKLWYCSMNGEGSQRLSVSDISFKHDMLDVPDFTGAFPIWSLHDKYLSYIAFDAKSRPYLAVFDGVESRMLSDIGFAMDERGLIGIDDETDRVLTLVKNAYITSAPLPGSAQKPAPSGAREEMLELPALGKGLMGVPYKTSWIGSDFLLCLVNGKEGNTLTVTDLSTKNASKTYGGVINFALSEDMKYICLVEEADGNTADVFVAEWKNGSIVNEKLVFKGFVASGSILFSPDDTKLFIQGRYNYTDTNAAAMTLQFK